MNKRFFLAMGLCLAFIILWNQIGYQMGFLEKKEPGEETIVETLPVENAEEVAEPEPPVLDPAEESVAQETAEETQALDTTPAVLENEQLKLVLSPRGGVIQSAVLKHFYGSTKEQEKIVLVASLRHFPGEVVLPDGISTRDRVFHKEQVSDRQVVFTFHSRGIGFRKTYTLEDGYKIGFSVENTGTQTGAFKVVVGEGLQPVRPGDRLKPSIWDLGAINPKIMQAAWSENSDHESKFIKDSDEDRFKALLKNPEWIEWAGVKDNYFANVFLPEKPRTNVFVKTTPLMRSGEKPVSLPVVALEAEDSLAGFFFMGPMKDEYLKQADARLGNLITYGWAGLLSKWLFLALEMCYGLLGNWGWAIILLTILIRIGLIPLTIPSVKSSYKMRKLQPKLEKIKAKYSGKDLETKQKLSQETFKLYKEEGVNPFSSCITALAQMPVFFAYFSLLRSSIYLRQAEWLFWIDDLSVKDPTYVLPIIMGATMFLTTLAMPMPAADPAQQKMMKIMPLIFCVMFIGMPAGLIIYMITSNVFTLAQTYFMKWRYDKG